MSNLQYHYAFVMKKNFLIYILICKCHSWRKTKRSALILANKYFKNIYLLGIGDNQDSGDEKPLHVPLKAEVKYRDWVNRLSCVRANALDKVSSVSSADLVSWAHSQTQVCAFGILLREPASSWVFQVTLSWEILGQAGYTLQRVHPFKGFFLISESFQKLRYRCPCSFEFQSCNL